MIAFFLKFLVFYCVFWWGVFWAIEWTIMPYHRWSSVLWEHGLNRGPQVKAAIAHTLFFGTILPAVFYASSIFALVFLSMPQSSFPVLLAVLGGALSFLMIGPNAPKGTALIFPSLATYLAWWGVKFAVSMDQAEYWGGLVSLGPWVGCMVALIWGGTLAIRKRIMADLV